MPKAYKLEMASEERSCVLFNYVKEELVPFIRKSGQDELAGKLEIYSQPLKSKSLRDMISTHFRRGWSGISELEERRDFFLNQLSSLSPEERKIVKKFAKAELEEIKRGPDENEDYYSHCTMKNAFSPKELKKAALSYILYDVPN